MTRRLRSKTDKLYLKWKGPMRPSDILYELLGNTEHARALFHGLRRQVRSIRSRSQNYDDGEVTIYDAALLRLYDNGHTMQDYGLFEFYLAEFLGTKKCQSDEEINTIIAAHLAAQRILDDGPIPNIPAVVDHAPVKKATRSTGHDLAIIPTANPTQGSDNNKPPHLDKLIETYEKAKGDYYILEVTESHGKQTSSVRFLRDTAENLLRYLESVDKGHNLIHELEQIIETSKTHANELAGGRKRKFERGNSGSRGSPSPSPYRPYGYYGESHGGYDRNSRWDRYVPKKGWNDSRNLDSYRP